MNADTINNNKGYVHVRNYCKWVEKDYGRDVTKCTNCAGREDIKGMGCCHLACGVGNDKKSCAVMNKDGYCTICGCGWGAHTNSTKYYVQEKFE